MTTQDVLEREFELLVEDLKTKHIELGMKASGKWLETVEVETTIDSAKIVGMNYTEQLEFGRRGGKMPPVSAIRQWIIDKGIVANAGKKISITSLAWAIAKKIQKEGWKRKKHGGVELVSQVVTPQRIQEIIDKVGAEMTLTLVSQIGKQVTEIAV